MLEANSNPLPQNDPGPAQDCRALPKFQSHKIVHALKIKTITDPNDATDGSRLITPDDEGYGAFCVTGEYMRKHEPQAGGYYVQYPDGYRSYSPAEAFESGYTRI